MPLTELPDKTLLILLKDDGADAFETIYRRYWRQLFVYVYQQTGSNEETKEIVQELMLSLWQNRTTSEINNLKAYLFIAARNLANKYFRKEINLRKYREYRLMQEIYESAGDDEIVSEKQLSDAIEKALQRLPEKTALIFRLNKLGDVPVKNIADQMGLSNRAVEYHLTKSMRVVKRDLLKFLSEN
jgi:RNA polymerase sigma-70 factor (family 1)